MIATLEENNWIQPLDQHWWPVTTVSSLKEDKPNGVQVLGQPLVLFYSPSNDEWKCLHDMCSHRFAPLSEGRVVIDGDGKECRIQCRNHEWEFDAGGACRKAPPLTADTSVDTIRGVTSYPVKVAAGMVWVYMGGDSGINTNPMEQSLPISPLLEKWHAQFGNDACFMRDLPVGMELVAENLLDLSRLPFSLHDIAGIDRSQATYMAMELIPAPGTLEQTRSSFLSSSKPVAPTPPMPKEPPSPLFSAKVLNAAISDPVYRSMRTLVPKESSVVVSFFAPNHIRIHRERGKGVSSATEVFLCPIAAGKTRVFFFNPFEDALKKSKDEDTPEPTFSYLRSQRKKSLVRKGLERLATVLQTSMLSPSSARYHMFAHDIFDGDGAILQQQGDRMRRWQLQSKDYASASSADIMVQSVASYLEKAVATTQHGGMVRSISASEDDGSKRYRGVSRAFGKPILLDRQSHTDNCPVCQKALQRKQVHYERLKLLQSTFIGTAGASTCFAFLLSAVSRQQATLIRAVAASALVSMMASLGLRQWKQLAFSKLQAFFFQEYTHT